MSSTVVVNQAPLEVNPKVAKSFFPETSDQLTEWDERFKRRKKVFNPNERVAVQATVEQDESGNPYLLTAEASCSADRFTPVELSTEGKDGLLQYVGMTVAASVTILSHTGSQFCHGGKYQIDTYIELALLPFNPTTEEVQQLPAGSHVVIEGVVTDFHPYEVPKYMNGRVYHTDKRGRLDVNTGTETLEVMQNTDLLLFDKGELENLYDKPVMMGEKVRLTAVVTEMGLLRSGYNRPYLLVPDPTRLAEYEELRDRVGNLLIELNITVANDQYQEARYGFASLRKMELTHSEASRVVELARHLPRDEQPIFQVDRRYEAEALETAFDINVESLNKARFMVFAHEVLTGVRENPAAKPLRVDQTYLYRFMDEDPFAPSETFTLIKEMLAARIPRLERCSDEQEDYWDDMYLIETSLGYLGRTGLTRAFDELATVVEYCLDRGYFRHVDENRDNRVRPRRFDDLLSKALQAILELFREDPILGVNSQYHVQDWKRRLEDKAEGFVLGDLRRLVPFS